MYMLSQHDIDTMGQTVRDILTSWNTHITMYVPKPEDQQTNWNAKMREYTGDIDYNATDLPANRQDYINDLKVSINMNAAGKMDDESVTYAVPDMIQVYNTDTKITSNVPVKVPYDAIFRLDDSDDRYHVSSVKVRIGEIIITMKRYVGGTPSGNGDIIGKD